LSQSRHDKNIAEKVQ